MSLIVFSVVLVTDLLLLYRNLNGIEAERHLPERLSNGDENRIQFSVINRYIFMIKAEVIDELPEEFQLRNFRFDIHLNPAEKQAQSYSLRPTERGEYRFGRLLVYAQSRLGLIKLRYTFGDEQSVPVYPSFIQMRKFELIAFSNKPADAGIKKIRRLGHTMEFDQIKEYVRGDDVRAINWKATARAGDLMVNTYQDERSQQVINVIDTGRVMKMPFDGMHLLDYAINTSLVISNIVLLKDDKAGLMTISNKGTSFVKPQKKRAHIRRIQEQLYNIRPNFLESDYRRMMVSLKNSVNGRSLVLFYTNFESLSSMERQLPTLRAIAKDHLLVVIFFENTELTSLLENAPGTVEDIYTKTVAESFMYEKRQIVRTLNHHGIQTILTPPKELSVNAINKYLELKARGML
ncbi:DUF58 domain-containing protein [Rhodohalobacter sp. 8-1]|uniref:DUF58 domain-containing protein n=1 Tax=Rhodohalobacter sp. 8-1 TaxID=3131972 RepID=UPI0030EED164